MYSFLHCNYPGDMTIVAVKEKHELGLKEWRICSCCYLIKIFCVRKTELGTS